MPDIDQLRSLSAVDDLVGRGSVCVCGFVSEVQRFYVVLLLVLIVGVVVEVGEAQRVGAFFLVKAVSDGPAGAVLGDVDGGSGGVFGVAMHGFHVFVVDEELAAVVAGEVDVVGVAEISKLQQIWALRLPDDLFADVAQQRIVRWR
ncbi:hypothetical protein ACQP2F_15235 [Actinoplanes sp. CA-030573]|uniref:hypothetical protein n=1 Tax=Actinoplanes sp. CA-030573 TaxID=3239898 RepID=UPI003D8AFC05